jgi:hypothetical protein
LQFLLLLFLPLLLLLPTLLLVLILLLLLLLRLLWWLIPWAFANGMIIHQGKFTFLGGQDKSLWLGNENSNVCMLTKLFEEGRHRI